MSMNWIEMEENLISVAKFDKNNELEKEFRCADGNESYYKDYGLGKHMNERIMEYDFYAPMEIRKYLNELWKNQVELKEEIIKILMMVQHDEKHLLDEVKGYNYTL